MTITRRIMTASLAALLSAALFLITAQPAQAQESAFNDATLTVEAIVNLTPVQALDFGTVLPGVGPVTQQQHALMDLESNPGNLVDIGVEVPSSLQGTNGSSIPLSYASFAAQVEICEDGSGNLTDSRFDPTTAAPQVVDCRINSSGTGSMAVGPWLGSSDAYQVTADVGSVPAGTYTGDIIWTVTVK